MSFISGKNDKKNNSSDENSSLYLGDNVSNRASNCQEKNMNTTSEGEGNQFYGYDDDWLRGPVSARYCGTMLWALHSGINLEMTIDNAIRILNYSTETLCAVSADGESFALLHDTGVAYAQKDCVEVRGCDPAGINDKYAKIKDNTIAFSTQKSDVVYVLDDEGIHINSSDMMTNLHQDISLMVFLQNCKCGRQYKNNAVEIINKSYYKLDEDGTQKWLANGVKVSYTMAGVLDILRKKGKIRLSMDMNGTTRISNPHVSLTVVGGKELLVRKEGLKVIYNDSGLVNVNSRQAVGFDRDGFFKFFD